MNSRDRVQERSRIFLRPDYFLQPADFSRCIVLLDGCVLETAKIGRAYKLLNADDHKTFLRRHSRDPALYRPDICHSCLLHLFDSPLSKAGLLEVYIRLHTKEIIKVHPLCRIPRTFKRFSGLMAQLIQRRVIKSGEGRMTLMKMVKGPWTQWIPRQCTTVLLTTSRNAVLTNLHQWIPSQIVGPGKESASVCFLVGGFSRGELTLENFPPQGSVQTALRISEYPLSAAACCAKITNAAEQAWGVL